MDNKYSVYLGDIDPNGKNNSPLEIRRTLMFQLLIWGSIVLSDSQLINDPRIYCLMSGFDAENADATEEFHNYGKLFDSMKGIEALFTNGLIEVAMRENGGKPLLYSEIWREMSGREKKVPFLPKGGGYAEYLDSLSIMPRIYSLDSVSSMFKRNLESGIGKSIILSDSSVTDGAVKELISEPEVLFSRLLDLINKDLENNRINQKRRDELYQFFYNCYSINVPSATDSFLTTDFKNIPLHIDTKNEEIDESASTDNLKLRPTWALDPRVLDYIDFDDFVEIRKKVYPHIKDGQLIRFFSNSLNPEDIKEFEDLWEDYTNCLEDVLIATLARKANTDNNKLKEMLKKPLAGASPEKETFFLLGLNVIKSSLGFVPGLGEVLGGAEFGSSVVNFFTFLFNFKGRRREYLADNYIGNVLQGNTKIITKY